MSQFSFFNEPLEVYNDLKSKNPKLSFSYDEIMSEARKRAFSVSKMMRLDLLKATQDSLAKAIKEGQSFKTWANEIKPKLKSEGWYGKTEITNPKTGEVKTINIGSSRLKSIYNNNIRQSYASARYETQMAGSAKYLRYSAVLDTHTRADHAKLHGVILPKDDPFWQSNYPPNGFNCRCKVQAISESYLNRHGLIPSDPAKIKAVADPAFSYSLKDIDLKQSKLLSQKADRALSTLSPANKEKLKALLDEIKSEQDRYVWQASLDEAIDEIIVKKNVKAPINLIPVGKLSAILANKASKLLGKDVAAGGIVLSKKELTHASPSRKDRYGHAFRVDEMREIVDVLTDESKAYVDLSNNHENIVFIFEDINDSSKLNLIPIEISKVHKKFKLSNYVITLDKVDKEEIQTLMDNGVIKKIK